MLFACTVKETESSQYLLPHFLLVVSSIKKVFHQIPSSIRIKLLYLNN